MNKQPVTYYQTDPRWSKVDYSTKGEKTTIGASGCGPTAMAMVLATWCDPSVTPETECRWALENGYKALRQGTYYAYFSPAAKRYGLVCRCLNASSLYEDSASHFHEIAKGALGEGHLVIACMGKGLWTSSGHFVLVWKIEGNTVFINDPASSKLSRTRGDYRMFKRQVKYYFVIEKPIKEEADMTEKEVKAIIDRLSDEAAYKLYTKAMRHLAKQPEPKWSRREGLWSKAKEAGITDGSRPCAPVSRVEAVTMIRRTAERRDR